MIQPSFGRRAVGVGALGRGVSAQLSASDCPPDVRLLASSDHLDGFRPPIAIQRPEVLVIERDALGPEPSATLVHLLDLSGAHTAIVVQEPRTEQPLCPLASARVRLLEHPVAKEELWQALVAVARDTGRDMPSLPHVQSFEPRRFDDGQLRRLAEVGTTIECGCPHHLARIVSSLIDFEAFSASCEVESSADEEMHADLRVEIARARAIVERALTRVLEHDAIELASAPVRSKPGG